MLLGLALALVLGLALMSPMESLRWWSARGETATAGTLALPDETNPAAAQPRRYAVYLSGVATVDAVTRSRRERATLDTVSEALPDLVLLDDVFPYAVENDGLTKRRTTSWWWSGLQKLQRVPLAKVASYPINLRNMLRVLVSADPRYGPTYNLAVARQITASLARGGYDFDNPVPVTIIGYSGGGQIALGSAWFVAALGIPVSVVSIGGVLSDDPALERIQSLDHLYGTRDRVQMLGPLLFPGRWPTEPLSDWHRAKKRGVITMTPIGPMDHNGPKSYFDGRTLAPDGRSYRQLTVDALIDVLR